MNHTNKENTEVYVSRKQEIPTVLDTEQKANANNDHTYFNLVTRELLCVKEVEKAQNYVTQGMGHTGTLTWENILTPLRASINATS